MGNGKNNIFFVFFNNNNQFQIVIILKLQSDYHSEESKEDDLHTDMEELLSKQKELKHFSLEQNK